MNNTAKLGAILPALLNPATAVIGVGIGLLWLLSEDEETADQPDAATVGDALTVGTEVGATAVAEPLLAVGSQPHTDVSDPRDTAPVAISDVEQKELIRKTMSELGKRSAAARAKRKAQMLEQS